MVSYAPDTQSYNYTHMYSFVDYRGKTPTPCLDDRSISGYLWKNKDFSLFRKIVEKADLLGDLNSSQANVTLFVPRDEYLKHIPKEFFDNMDVGLAKQIIACSSMNRVINAELVRSSPVSYYMTRDRTQKMYITNISGVTRINQCATVKQFNIALNNGMIHVIDNILVPTSNSY